MGGPGGWGQGVGCDCWWHQTSFGIKCPETRWWERLHNCARLLKTHCFVEFKRLHLMLWDSILLKLLLLQSTRWLLHLSDCTQRVKRREQSSQSSPLEVMAISLLVSVPRMLLGAHVGLDSPHGLC